LTDRGAVERDRGKEREAGQHGDGAEEEAVHEGTSSGAQRNACEVHAVVVVVLIREIRSGLRGWNLHAFSDDWTSIDGHASRKWAVTIPRGNEVGR
jgi:hypothetical protein